LVTLFYYGSSAAYIVLIYPWNYYTLKCQISIESITYLLFRTPRVWVCSEIKLNFEYQV